MRQQIIVVIRAEWQYRRNVFIFAKCDIRCLARRVQQVLTRALCHNSVSLPRATFVFWSAAICICCVVVSSTRRFACYLRVIYAGVIIIVFASKSCASVVRVQCRANRSFAKSHVLKVVLPSRYDKIGRDCPRKCRTNHRAILCIPVISVQVVCGESYEGATTMEFERGGGGPGGIRRRRNNHG
jgi:hypothetical protein